MIITNPQIPWNCPTRGDHVAMCNCHQLLFHQVCKYHIISINNTMEFRHPVLQFWQRWAILPVSGLRPAIKDDVCPSKMWCTWETKEKSKPSYARQSTVKTWSQQNFQKFMIIVSYKKEWAAFHSIHHGVLCVTSIMKFCFHHMLKLPLHMGIYIYIYILSKIQKFWPKNATFFGLTISAVLSICSMMHDKHYVL